MKITLPAIMRITFRSLMKIMLTAITPIPKNRLFRIVLFIISISGFIGVNAQTGQWTWVSGDNTVNNVGVYGVKGTAAAANKPGNRNSQSGWKDASGNFWIFGGLDFNGDAYNDLWMYNVSTGQWTWVSGNNGPNNNNGVYGVKGVPAATTVPGARYGQTAWVDAVGNFWVFGGVGTDGSGNSGYLNSLWKYSPLTNLWTWVSGDNTRNMAGVYGTKGVGAALNKPGGRNYQASWMDASGNLWIFGGYGYDAAGNLGGMNDLWKYNPVTNQWTWISGDNTRNMAGVYGAKGTAAAANKPGIRYEHSGWVDALGSFWVFGGAGYDGSGSLGWLNDLWKYDPVTNQWTWVSGDNTLNNAGIYGTKGTAAVANKPGSRFGQSAVVDGGGNFWIFGGLGYDGSGGLGELNDLLKYSPSTGQWTWTSGDNTRNNLGVYGTKGVPAAANKPGGRSNQSAWVDASNNLWVFAGVDFISGVFNDLWKFTSLVTLPIRQVTLEGVNHSNENYLIWRTAGEVNTTRFEVERSVNGREDRKSVV